MFVCDVHARKVGAAPVVDRAPMVVQVEFHAAAESVTGDLFTAERETLLRVKRALEDYGLVAGVAIAHGFRVLQVTSDQGPALVAAGRRITAAADVVR